MISAKMDLNEGIEFELIERLSTQARNSLDDARDRMRPVDDPSEVLVDVSRHHCSGRTGRKVKPFCRRYIVWAIAQMKSSQVHNDFRQGTW